MEHDFSTKNDSIRIEVCEQKVISFLSEWVSPYNVKKKLIELELNSLNWSHNKPAHGTYFR